MFPPTESNQETQMKVFLENFWNSWLTASIFKVVILDVIVLLSQIAQTQKVSEKSFCGKSTLTNQPSEGTFNNPTLGKSMETILFFGFSTISNFQPKVSSTQETNSPR